MNQTAIQEDIAVLHRKVDDSFAALSKKVDDSFNDLATLMQTFMHQVDERFTKVEHELGDLKQSHDRLLNTIDGFITRIDKYETEQLARDHQFEKLLAWARKVSEKTGIPLENL